MVIIVIVVIKHTNYLTTDDTYSIFINLLCGIEFEWIILMKLKSIIMVESERNEGCIG